MKRCVIVGGAPVGDYAAVKRYLKDGDVYLVCDSGLNHLEGLGIHPDLVVGDFDSHARPDFPVETIVLPVIKDDTDTVFAAREAVARGFKEVLLVGVAGGRLDHTLGNLAILFWLDKQGVRAMAVDDYAEMEVVREHPALVGPEYPYFSLLNLTGRAEGVQVENAKYPLKDAVITCEYPYGVSNEPLPGKTARICVAQGELLLLRIRKA